MKKQFKEFKTVMAIEAAAALLMGILFFVTWLKINVVITTFEFSGANTFSQLRDLLSYVGRSPGAGYLFLLLYLIPIMVVITIIIFFTRKRDKMQKSFIALCITVVIELLLLIIILPAMVKNAGAVAQMLADNLVKTTGAFWILLILAAAGLVFAIVKRPQRYEAEDAVLSGKGVFALSVIKGEYQGATIKVPPEGIVIGRDPELANLVLSAKNISRKHCMVEQDTDGRGLLVTDYSSQGTSIGQVTRLEKGVRTHVFAGQVLYLGGSRQAFEVRKA